MLLMLYAALYACVQGKSGDDKEKTGSERFR